MGQQKYLTIVWDHDRSRIVWIGRGRERDTLARFIAKLGPVRASRLEAVTMDMAHGYISAVREHARLATIVLDLFHIERYLTRALDEIRKAELRRRGGVYRDAVLAHPAHLQGSTNPLAGGEPRRRSVMTKAELFAFPPHVNRLTARTVRAPAAAPASTRQDERRWRHASCSTPANAVCPRVRLGHEPAGPGPGGAMNVRDITILGAVALLPACAPPPPQPVFPVYQPPAASPPAHTDPGTIRDWPWEVQESVSKLDASTNVVATKVSSDAFVDAMGDTHNPKLVVRCDEGRLRVGVLAYSDFSIDTYDDYPSKVRMSVRLGDAPAAEIVADVDSDRQSAYLPDAAAALEQLRAAADAAVQFTPMRVSAVTASFAIGDFASVYEQVQRACASR